VKFDEHRLDKARNTPRADIIEFIPDPEPEVLFCPMISVDDHLLEPPTLFEGRLTAKLQPRAPRVVEDERGVPWWEIDGTPFPLTMVNGAATRPMSQWDNGASKWDDFGPGVMDPKRRLRDMDVSGIWASLCFPSSPWGFAGTRFSLMQDSEVGLACLQAYNDWMLEEWCGAAPDRYIPCQLSWFQDPHVAAAEVRRNAARGYRAVSFSENPAPLGFSSLYGETWDPFFAACAETGTVVNLHVGSSGVISQPSPESPQEVNVCLFPVAGLAAMFDWIYARIPVRFPELKIVLSEAGVSWVPMAIERLRRAYRQCSAPIASWSPNDIDPVELVHRNFYFTSIEDPAGFRLLDLIGDDHVMVETDYPHYDSTWPFSQAMIESELAELPAESIRKVCYGNAASLYRHPEPPAAMLAASTIGTP
jgi:predicted TIM-barrel fold metal-dependent hydrolase